MGRPRMTFFGQSCQANLVFTTLKWAVVLLIGWVLRHGYLVSGLGTKSFSKGSWLDILDAILFSENLSSDCIRNLSHLAVVRLKGGDRKSALKLNYPN